MNNLRNTHLASEPGIGCDYTVGYDAPWMLSPREHALGIKLYNYTNLYLTDLLRAYDRALKAKTYSTFLLGATLNDESCLFDHYWPEATVINVEKDNIYNPLPDTDLYFARERETDDIWFIAGVKDVTKFLHPNGKHSRAGIITLVWKYNYGFYSTQYRGFTKKLLFQILFSKYSYILSDYLHNETSKGVWRDIIEEADRLKFRYSPLVYDKHDKAKLESRRPYWGYKSYKDFDKLFDPNDKMYTPDVVFGIYKSQHNFPIGD